MTPEKLSEKMVGTLKHAEEIGATLVKVFNDADDQAAVLVAVGGILGSSCPDMASLKRDLLILEMAAFAEFKMKTAHAERVKHADA